MTNLFKYNWGILLVILLSFWAVKPLFVNGFFTMHDDTQVARVFEMGKMLKDGMFPVRWVPDLGYGYGYPIFNFYAPLAYYAGGLFTLLGFDALIATKIMMGIGILLSGIFMYLLAREFWGELGGVISGLFYLYAPYHALDIYVRGDVAEFWAYAFLPLMIYGFYKVFAQANVGGSFASQNSKLKTQNSKLQLKIQKFGIIGTLSFAGIILSHNLTALMVTPFLLASFLILIIYSKKETRILITLYLLLYTLLGLALSAFYWIPALLEMKYTNVLSQIGGGADFRDHFVCVGQLWESNWGFGGSIPGCIDGLSFRTGKLHMVVPFVVLVLVLISLIKNKYYNFNKNYIVAFLSLAGFTLSTFFTLEISRSIWEPFPTMVFFQYPWRFLLLASFFSSILTGFCIWFLKVNFFEAKYFNTVPYLSGAALLFLLIFFNTKLFQPQTILSKTSSDYTNEYALKWTASKISDEFLPPNFKKPQAETEITKSPPTPPQETGVQKISNIISLCGIVILALGIIVKDKKRLSV